MYYNYYQSTDLIRALPVSFGIKFSTSSEGLLDIPLSTKDYIQRSIVQHEKEYVLL